MARRVLTIHELTFREKGKREGVGREFAPSDLLGDDLLELFYTWVAGLTESDTADPGTHTWVTVNNVFKYASRVLVVETSVGTSGESGEVVDSETGRTEFQLSSRHAPTGITRTVLLVPERGRSAFLMSEWSRRGSGGSRIRQLFVKHSTENLGLIKMDCHTVSEGEAWAEHAKLKEVELRVEGRPVDVADGPDIQVGIISHVARPPRRGFFPRDLIGQLIRDKDAAKRVVGLPTEATTEREDVYITLVEGQRQKKFLLDGGGAPSFRLVLNEDGSDPLSTSEIVAKCVEQLAEIAGRTGKVEWDPRWSKQLKEKRGENLSMAHSE